MASDRPPRVRRCWPPPQVALHAVQSVNEESSQSVGHAWELHVAETEEASQYLPPNAGWSMTLRERVLWPPPQDTVHSSHSPQEAWAQSLGQECMLHSRVTWCGGHAAPPLAASWATVRERVWLPDPQDAVQLDHAPKAVMRQSSAHGSLAQTCSW